jgi:transposase
VNRSYEEMASHYRTADLPARPDKPRDKAKVEAGVLLATRWISANLRNRKFFTLAELNEAIGDCLRTLNDKVSRYLGASRTALFNEVERAALKPLPAEPYEFAAWMEVKPSFDYHVEVGKHYYSVPHALIKEKMWARITSRTVEVFHNGKRVAAHVRSSSNRKHTTIDEHMPPRLARARRRRSRSSCERSAIPSRASARRSASSASPSATHASASRPPAHTRSPSARAPTDPSSRS